MRIRKEYQVIPTNALLENGHSTSATNGYTCEYINKISDYSTTEQVIGRWTDGKPLYRKTIDTTSPADTTDTTIANIGTGKMVVRIDGCLIDSATYQSIPVNFYYSDAYSIATYVTNNNGNIHMKLNSANYQNKAVKIIVEYTKTTD